MDKDANVEAKSNNGWTALHHACHYQRNPGIIQLLFELKADADAETNDGSTPLHLASRNENTTREIIDLLIEKQANVYAENNDGWSPLQHAHPDVVDLLLHHHTKNANSNDKPGHVCISGGGPVGLITAAMLLDNSRISDQPPPKIHIFDSRWAKDEESGNILWRGQNSGNNRRQQVVTLQSNV